MDAGPPPPVHRAFAGLRLNGAMALDPVIGSLVWVASSIAFLAASTAVVRLLDARGQRTGSTRQEDAAS
jgi:hypothetical protein